MSDWVIAFCPDTGGQIPQEARFATERPARELFAEIANYPPDDRLLIIDERGYEFLIYPSRYCVVLNSPRLIAGKESAARAAQGQNEGGLITGGLRSSH